MTKPTREREDDYPVVLTSLLIGLAGLAAVISTAAAVLRLEAMLDESAPLLEALLSAGVYVTAGWSVAALLLTATWIVRRQQQAQATRRHLLAALNGLIVSRADQPPELPPVGPVQQVPAAAEDHDWKLDRLLEELAELNANMLMTDEQLRVKRAHRQRQIADRLVESIRMAIEDGRFPTAEQLLEQLIAQVPDDPRYAEQTDRLAQARAEAEAADISRATDEAEDMMAVGRFQQAEQVAQALLAKHPSAAGAVALLDHVRRQRRTMETEQKQELYREVEKQAEARQWRKAVEAAERLIRLYPKSAEADLLAAQMATLTDNARIEQARELRDQVRDLLARKRYAEALEAARELVEKFPETQGAIDLRDQIPRLEELAAKGEQ